MKKETLDTAIQLGQLLSLLTPLACASKAFHQRLSRLRAGVEGQVVLAVTGDAEVSRRAEVRIADMHKALEKSVKHVLDVQDLLRRSAGGREVYLLNVVRKGARRMNCDVVLLGDAEAVKLEPSPGKKSDQAKRAEVVHAYASAVRNSPWLPTLLRLELGLTLATAENTRLVYEHSSHDGREALPATLRKLCVSYPVADTRLSDAPAKPAGQGAKPTPKRTRAKKIVVKAESMFAVQVACKAETLLAHADIAALSSVTFKGAEPAPTLAHLLEKATAPVVVAAEETPAGVAQRIIDELVAGLVARKKLADDERAALRAKVEAAAAESAVAALQQLSPAVVAALKKNPALIQRA